MIIRMGWRFFFRSFNDLMDSAVDEDTEERIRGHLLSTPGLHGIHGLKTRKLGDMIWDEVDLEMDGELTISEGHIIDTEARKRVMQNETVQIGRGARRESVRQYREILVGAVSLK